MARRRTFQRSNAPRRHTEWIGGISTGYTGEKVISAAATVIDSAFDSRVVGNMSFTPSTLVRMRGLFQVFPADLALDRVGFGALGLIIVSGEAFDAGAASVPAPWTESHYDGWLFHQYWSSVSKVDINLGTGSDQAVSGAAMEPRVIDSKAMRKFQDGDVLVMVIEAVSSGVGAQYFLNYRLLFKLT